jgi:hypothetical protein
MPKAEGLTDEGFINSFLTEGKEDVEDKVETKVDDSDDVDDEELEELGISTSDVEGLSEDEIKELKAEKKKEKDDEDDLEDNTSNIKPLMASIREEYPDFFKKFPELKDSFFRARAFSQIFATPEEAKEAFADNEAYLSLRESALSGDPTPVLNTLKETDSDAFTNYSRKFLPSLFKLDKDLYAEATLPILQGTLRHIFDEGKRHNNEDLQTAVNLVAEALGLDGAPDGTKNYVKPVKEIVEDKEEVQASFNEALGIVTKNISESLSKEIRRGLDPDGALTAFMRKGIIGETIEGINQALVHDKSFMTAQAARWNRAKREGFGEESTRKIINAYLARAKSLVPNVRRKVLEQAVGDNKSSTNSRVDRLKNKTGPKEITSGRDSKGGKASKPDTSKVDWDKTSDFDFLSGNITYRS